LLANGNKLLSVRGTEYGSKNIFWFEEIHFIVLNDVAKILSLL